MNQRLKTPLLVIFALAFVVTGIFAWQQYRTLHSPNGDATGTDDSASLRKKLADAEHRAHALQNELDALKAKQSPDTPSDEPPTPPNEADGPRGGRFRGGPDSLTELMNDPAVVALMNSREKLMLDSRYAALFKNLMQSGKLNPEQLEAFKNLLVERQNTLRDIRQSAREQGITDRSQIGELVKKTQAELDAQLQSTLGAAAYADFQAYEKTYPQRNLVNQLTQSLSYTSSPLNDAQAQQLVDILASTATNGGNNRREGGGGFGGGPGGNVGGGGVTVTDATLAAAQPVLTPTQFIALTEFKKQQEAQQKLRETIRAARQGNTTPATPAVGTSKVAK